MQCTAKNRVYRFNPSDTVILFLPSAKPAELISSIPAEFVFLKENADLSFFKGKQGEIALFPFARHPTIILCGIGEPKEADAESLRRAGAAAASVCRDKAVDTAHCVIPSVNGMEESAVLAALTEGFFLANYAFDRYKKKKEDNGKHPVRRLVAYTGVRDASLILNRITTICRNTLLCRDLVNETSEQSDAEGIAREALALKRLPKVSCRVYGRRELEKMKMGLLLAVNRGSGRPPRLVVLTYLGAGRGKPSIAIIGKGITFDAGGMNLKPTGHIEDMRTDMAGAAAALYAFKSAAELGLKKNIHAVLPLTENMLARDSYRPGDIYTAFNGMTVEIGNTDAEGRLILADALAYTEKTLKPSAIIDIATLTGACLVTFGEIAAGYVATDDSIASLLEEASRATGEWIWRLPLFKDYEENVKSDIADVCNVSPEKNAGTIMGGMFLKQFVTTSTWAHIDIAGTARHSKPRGYRPKHATGFGVRLLVDVIERWHPS